MYWLNSKLLCGSGAATKSFSAYEFGLLSEAFKVGSRSTHSVTRDASAVNTVPNAAEKVAEWRRNAGFTAKNRVASGDKGVALVYWTESASPAIHLRFKEYLGFTDTWSSPAGLTTLDRGWNWVAFNAGSRVHFILGSDTTLPTFGAGNSPTNQVRQTLSMTNYAVTSTTFTSANYKNGAEELTQNVGNGTEGDYSVYRSCWKERTGFLIRNDGVGAYFRLHSFYRTEGTLADEFQYFRKLPDMPGTTKVEGQLVALAGGIYFFNNSGEIAVWNDTTSVWTVGGPGAGSTPFRLLQDQTAAGFDDPYNTLVAASDGDRKAYLSFDYSSDVFLRFNEATLSFGSLGGRPAGEQLLAGVY
jgi:hypothetical protein